MSKHNRNRRAHTAVIRSRMAVARIKWTDYLAPAVPDRWEEEVMKIDTRLYAMLPQFTPDQLGAELTNAGRAYWHRLAFAGNPAQLEYFLNGVTINIVSFDGQMYSSSEEFFPYE